MAGIVRVIIVEFMTKRVPMRVPGCGVSVRMFMPMRMGMIVAVPKKTMMMMVSV